MATHKDAIRIVTELLTGKDTGIISDLSEISAVGHRVLHGGEKFSASVLIDDAVIETIEECIPLGPLHNPANLSGIQALKGFMKGVPQVAVFDTAFHQSMPEAAYVYAIPYEFYEKYHVRRYGFHGTSHRYVSGRAAEFLGKPAASLKIITCHLGNGSSLAAVKNGRCVDTSMGLTPLEGVPMGTRSGSIDPAILGFLAERENLSAAELVRMLNNRSGVLGISGVSSDFRDLDAAAKDGNARARLALDIFVYSVKKYIGSFAAAMGGADVLAFTGGIEENNAKMRADITQGLDFMGLSLDKEKNEKARGEAVLSKDDSPAHILCIPTNEELAIAMDTLSLISGD